MPAHVSTFSRPPTATLEAVSKPPARRCAAVGGGWQETTTTSIGTKIRGGGATPPAAARRKQRPREVSKQLLTFHLRPYHRDTPNSEILKDLRRAAATSNSKILTQPTYKLLGKFACSTVIRRFGTWNSAIISARLTPSLLTNTTPTQLLNDIKRVAKKLRLKKMLLRQYTQHGRHSPMVIQRHFKTWQHAARAAGLTPAKFQNIPTSALLADIEQVWRRLGRQPSYSQMYPPLSKYNIMTHCRHFNGFQNALKAFVRWSSIRDERPEPAEGTTLKKAESPKRTRPNQPEESHAQKSYKRPPHSINYRLRYLTLRRDHYRCRACGRSPATTPNLHLQVDHILPTSRGGKSTLDNLQSLCQTCNLGKSNLDWKSTPNH